MGTVLSFFEEARAAKVAQELSRAGYGTIWIPSASPNLIVTALERKEAREFVKGIDGIELEWSRMENIDTNTLMMNEFLNVFGI